MKRKNIRMFVVLLLLCLLVSGCRSVPITTVTYFSFTTNPLSFMYGKRYVLECSEGTYTATISPLNLPDSQALVVEVDPSVMRGIESLLSKYDVGKWDGYDKKLNASDGTYCYFHVEMENGDTIDATWYSAPPNHGIEVEKELEEIFMGIYRQYRPQ